MKNGLVFLAVALQLSVALAANNNDTPKPGFKLCPLWLSGLGKGAESDKLMEHTETGAERNEPAESAKNLHLYVQGSSGDNEFVVRNNPEAVKEAVTLLVEKSLEVRPIGRGLELIDLLHVNPAVVDAKTDKTQEAVTSALEILKTLTPSSNGGTFFSVDYFAGHPVKTRLSMRKLSDGNVVIAADRGFDSSFYKDLSSKPEPVLVPLAHGQMVQVQADVFQDATSSLEPVFETIKRVSSAPLTPAIPFETWKAEEIGNLKKAAIDDFFSSAKKASSGNPLSRTFVDKVKYVLGNNAWTRHASVEHLRGTRIETIGQLENLIHQVPLEENETENDRQQVIDAIKNQLQKPVDKNDSYDHVAHHYIQMPVLTPSGKKGTIKVGVETPYTINHDGSINLQLKVNNPLPGYPHRPETLYFQIQPSNHAVSEMPSQQEVESIGERIAETIQAFHSSH